MSIEEIVHTCSNEKVAQAAVASLGVALASRVRTEADLHGLTMGAYAARVVQEFDETAGAGERRAIRNVMHKADQPVLTGLRCILERRLDAGRARDNWPVGPMPLPSRCGLSLPGME